MQRSCLICFAWLICDCELLIVANKLWANCGFTDATGFLMCKTIGQKANKTELAMLYDLFYPTWKKTNEL